MAYFSSNEPRQLFELQPGKTLDLQINHPVPLRLKLTLVGYETGKYILLKYPRVARASDYKDVLIEGNMMIVRYLMEGNKGECFAFRSSIKHVALHPEKLLYLEYPKKIENRQLRTQQRTSIHIPATIMLEGKDNEDGGKINGVISDISLKGCGFAFKSKSDKTNVNKINVFVCIQSPIDGEVRVPAKVCNSRNVDGSVNVGIQFLDTDNKIPKLLEQLFIEPSNS
ncbi:PilZ domain-containing protein [Pseudocolwellia agarivorans]|uniref:PilZ domain-containing protein n=1 Tax=Pseudocolwellia agarivorans TaxID=1911682 RepID=UPI0009876DEC|nr:flagellar brake protein [Pseudocolwellia agarivorans]